MTTRPDTPASSMTIREHFAALAMQGLVTRGYEGGQSIPTDIMASWSVSAADALIAALNEENSR